MTSGHESQLKLESFYDQFGFGFAILLFCLAIFFGFALCYFSLQREKKVSFEYGSFILE